MTTLPAPIADHMVYVVVCKARSGAFYTAERDLSDCDRSTTISDIISGQFEGWVQVLEVNPVENVCNDVTEAIVEEVKREIIRRADVENFPVAHGVAA